jgi:uncharacterized protein with NRDE domain
MCLIQFTWNVHRDYPLIWMTSRFDFEISKIKER